MDLTTSQWERIEALYHEACALPDDARDAYLDALPDPDPQILDVLRRLLAQSDAELTLFDAGVGSAIEVVLARPHGQHLPTERFGPYRAIGVLGEGGMGVVYLAEREDVGARAALKVLWDAALSPALRERFVEEQRILARLRHPAIVTLYDAGVRGDGTPWFAMEHVDGAHLIDHCRSRQRSVRERLGLFATACEAVSAAHQQLVVHGDLKPSNILVDTTGRVRLLDFGVADRLDRVHDDTTYRARRLTPAYAAPEHRRGESLAVQADVYSLGVLLFEMLAERRPNEDEREGARVSRSSALRGTSAARGVDWEDIDAICRRAMHADPASRYHSVEALHGDVARFLAQQPVTARADGAAYRARKFALRHRGKLVWGSVVVTVAAAIGIASLVSVTSADARARAEAVRTERIQAFMANLLTGGEDVSGPPDSLRVVTLLEGGLRNARSLSGDREAQAELYHTLGSAFRTLGKLDRADSLLRLALATRRSLGTAAATSATVAELALLRADQARPDSAAALANEALALVQPGGTPQALALAWEAKGRVHEQAGKNDSAVTALRAAVATRVASTDTSTVAFANLLIHLANTRYYLGQYDSAAVVNRRVLALVPAVLPKGHPVAADALINLGAIEKDRGNAEESLRLTKEGTDLIEAWYGPEHHRTASAWGVLGRALFARERYDEALDYFRKALAVRERVYGATHPLVANILNEIANVSVVTGHVEDAVPLFQRIVDIYRTRYNGKHYLIGLYQGNLAGSYLRLNRPVDAEREIRAGLAMYAQTLPPEHINVGIHRIRLGMALEEQRRHREAIVESTAGYDLVAKQTQPQILWLRNARRTLLRAWEAVGDSAQAARYRRELADTALASPPTKKD
jgi:serine/threonine-protein kinase